MNVSEGVHYFTEQFANRLEDIELFVRFKAEERIFGTEGSCCQWGGCSPVYIRFSEGGIQYSVFSIQYSVFSIQYSVRIQDSFTLANHLSSTYIPPRGHAGRCELGT
jgi:hypothetical protein